MNCYLLEENMTPCTEEELHRQTERRRRDRLRSDHDVRVLGEADQRGGVGVHHALRVVAVQIEPASADLAQSLSVLYTQSEPDLGDKPYDRQRDHAVQDKLRDPPERAGHGERIVRRQRLRLERGRGEVVVERIAVIDRLLSHCRTCPRVP